jgi:ribose transport system permease protein
LTSESPQGLRARLRRLGRSAKLPIRPDWETLGLPAATVVVALIFAYLSPNFLTISNFANVARQVSVLALITWGETIVILTAGIDLSVGSVVALVSVFAAMGMLKFGPLGFILYGLVAGIGAGFINGLIISRLHVTPFIATLGMLSIARGAALTVTSGVPVFGLPDSRLYEIGEGYIGRVPVPVVFAAVGLVVAAVILYRTRFGNYVYAVGGNEASAILAGIDAGRVKLLVYTLSGTFAAIGGLVLTARVRSGQPLLASGLELQAIAAVVIGGVSLFGGRGRLAGTVWGVILIGILANGLDLIQVSTFVQQIVIGVVIVAAVAGTIMFRRSE